MATSYTVSGLSGETADRVGEILQQRLVALIDLSLTLKHVHWNVVGPTFIGVHQMLDPQVEKVRSMVDDVAERIATLGREPVGTPSHIAANRDWTDYELNRALVPEHLGALDVVYEGVVSSHRRAIGELEELDLVSQDLLIDQAESLERFQWFVRAHLEDGSGKLPTAGDSSEVGAARDAAQSGRLSATR